MGESTCSGVFAGRSVEVGGFALLSVDELSRIALERATTAKQAVQIMGDLAVEYGFYGESASFEGGSESMIVIDAAEAWVFHILASPNGHSAVWAAARVPDDSAAAVNNMFSIRVMDDDTDNFLHSPLMWEIAAEHGYWAEGQPKDFTATFSDGEYAHKYYSGRRSWAVFNLLAPSQALPVEYGNLNPNLRVVDPSIYWTLTGMMYWSVLLFFSTLVGHRGGYLYLAWTVSLVAAHVVRRVLIGDVASVTTTPSFRHTREFSCNLIWRAGTTPLYKNHGD